MRLPSDFVELSTFHESVVLDDFLSLLIPVPGDEAGFVSAVQALLSTLGDLRDSDMTDGHVPFPEPGGLLPWANSNEGDLLFWKTGDPDPDRWPVVVGDGISDWEETRETLTGFLTGLVRGTVESEILPAGFPSADAVVTGWEAS